MISILQIFVIRDTHVLCNLILREGVKEMQVARKQIFVAYSLSGGDLLVVNSVTFLTTSFFFLAKVFPQQRVVRILREFFPFAAGDNHVNAIS